MEKASTLLCFLVLTLTLSLSPITTSAAGKSTTKPTKSAALTPSPAPAPSAEYINITHLLSVAGPFHTFLSYLQSTGVIDTFQNQANNSAASDHQGGITVFVPKDSAFSSLKSPSLKNLTADQLKSLCLFHALPHYYSMSDFQSLSQRNPVPTFSGAALNITDSSGEIYLNSGWTHTKVTSSVVATNPVALYEVDKVLLPVAIFGTDIPPAAAPAPAPVTEAKTPEAAAPDADSPTGGAKSATADSSPAPAGSGSSDAAPAPNRLYGWRSLGMMVAGIAVYL